ncbi:glycosyltransferase family 10 [Mucilaginibacter gossypii]|uniref:glycosyltransferase family 10 domain-containing protein n=1 Tax=Mucilaginibacter gossypii TaxID=551996 RepID=UPI000DCD416A|nr:MULTISPECIES: glycosyltransferase family 10 [Mucilaginibacter]QTE39769.1 glycosyltransferase family 10 [Mucilaginibacter gossypii]RAV54149.1 alpha-1,3-fucosyltransferase [Mucilaginibacter rubeus]
MQEKKEKILMFNKTWDMKDEGDFTIPIVDGFELTTEQRFMDEAIAVIFHMPTLSLADIQLIRHKKKAGQFWVFWSMECEAHYSWQSEPEILGLFDIKATYKFDSDIVVPYLYPNYQELLRRASIPKTGFINAFISSSFDLSGRYKYLKELMNYVAVDSYGKTLKNKTIPQDSGENSKLELIAGYKFSLAFENARAHDYVTEKLYQPLIAGSVPVYLGASNVEDFAPGEKCFINVDKFATVKAAADYLLELANNEEEYNRFLKWKTEPFRKEFNDKMEAVKLHPLKRLCKVIEDKVAMTKFQ